MWIEELPEAVQRAMLALNETVRVAQQLNDDSCLQHALAQLCRLLLAGNPAVAKLADSPPGIDHLRQLQRLLLRSVNLLRENKQGQYRHSG